MKTEIPKRSKIIICLVIGVILIGLILSINLISLGYTYFKEKNPVINNAIDNSSVVSNENITDVHGINDTKLCSDGLEWNNEGGFCVNNTSYNHSLKSAGSSNKVSNKGGDGSDSSEEGDDVLVPGEGYYIDADNGDDNNSGTIDSPWRTWQKIQEVLEPGDVAFLTGDFKDIVISSEDPIGTFDNWITYLAWPGKSFPKFNHINFDGTIKNAYLIFDGIYVDPGYLNDATEETHVVNLRGTNYVIFMNSYFEGEKIAGDSFNSGDFAPYVFPYKNIIGSGESPGLSSFITFKNCTFKNAYRGIYIVQHPNYPERKVENWTIVDNEFSLCGEDCIITSVSGNHYIANNYFHDLNQYKTVFCWAGSFVGDWSNLKGQRITQDITNNSAIFYKILDDSSCAGYSGDVILIYADDINNLPKRTTNTTWRLDSNQRIYFSPINTGDNAHSDFISLQSASHDNLIEGNEFNQSKFGAQTMKIEPAAYNITFRNNLIYAEYTGAYQILLAGTNVRIYSNTIDVRDDNHLGSGLRLITTTSSPPIESETYLKNNIISGAVYSSGVVTSEDNIWASIPPAQFNEGSNSLVDVNMSSIFSDRENYNYFPLMSSFACNGSINSEEVVIGALPCIEELSTQSPLLINWIKRLLGWDTLKRIIGFLALFVCS